MTTKHNKPKISLRDDITFKHFFKNNEKALISLLKNFLPLPKGRKIQKVQILDSLMPAFKTKVKDTVMDLRLTMDNKERVNVEMQMCPHRAFTERVLFYWAKNYMSQLKEGESYDKLFPVYSLIFCDFNLFAGIKEFYSSFSIRSDKDPYFTLNPHLRMVFVELRKFKKEDIKSLLDLREAWCYLLRWFEDMSSLERQLFAKKNKAMEELMDWTRPLSLKEQEQVLAEAREKNWRDRMAREDYVFEQGLAEGKAEGLQKGMEKGMEKGLKAGKAEGLKKGMEKGFAKGRQELILNMLKEKADMILISKVTGLSQDEIKKLKNGA